MKGEHNGKKCRNGKKETGDIFFELRPW